MKKLVVMFAVLSMMAATSFAQDSVPATKVNGKSNLDTLLQPLMEKLKDVADDDDEQAAKVIFNFAKENPNEAGVYVITNLLAYMTKTEDLIKLVDENEYFKKDEKIQEAKEQAIRESKVDMKERRSLVTERTNSRPRPRTAVKSYTEDNTPDLVTERIKTYKQSRKIDEASDDYLTSVAKYVELD